MLTIFGNLRINDKERLQHMKDSFRSFSSISDDWVINIRGKYREEAMRFLKSNLKNKLTLFDLTNDERGWSNNALEMLRVVKNNYVFFWNEDHINLVPQEYYKELMRELIKEKVDVMRYSWWLFGKQRRIYESLRLRKMKYTDVFSLSKSSLKKMNSLGFPFYIISMMSIMKKSFFRRLLIMESQMFPFEYTKKLRGLIDFLNTIGFKLDMEEMTLFVNRLCLFRLRRYPEVTPFNIEKEQFREDILPIRVAWPKRELFACIDDDAYEPGYSLVSRGLYKSAAGVKNKGGD